MVKLRLRPSLVCLTVLFLAALATSSSRAEDLSVLLMNSTFEITGKAADLNGAPQLSYGTVFFLGKQFKSDPKHGEGVLVTAAHVLNEIVSDDATLMLRSKNSDGTFTSVPYSIKIREGGKPLYTTNPNADVAVMYQSIPVELHFDVLPLSFLVDDARITHLEIHPGDELLCLGFPLFTNFNTFPVIRSGLLASYPLIPSLVMKTFYYNFHVFPGNSGGPVYFSFSNRVFGGATNIGTEQGILGLVIQQLNSKLPGHETEQLDMAVIIPSSRIAETIALLPDHVL
jgi:hypothetical protein